LLFPGSGDLITHCLGIGLQRPWYSKAILEIPSAPPLLFEHLDGGLVAFAESYVFQSWWLLSLSLEGEITYGGSH
jgi:hypothetical protein